MKSPSPFIQRGRRPPPPEVAEVMMEYARALGLLGGFDDPPKNWRLAPRDGRFWCINGATPVPPTLFGRLRLLPLVRRGAIFGHRLPNEACEAIGDIRRPGRGKFVRDDDRLAVAEVKRTACYLLFDLLSWPGPTAALVVRKVLDAALAVFGGKLVAASPLSDDARQLAIKTLARQTMAAEAAWERQRESETRAAFEKAGGGHAANRQSDLEAEIASLEKNLEEFSRRMTADSRRLMKYRQELAALEGEEADEPADFGAEYDRIRAYPLVHDLAVEDDRFVVTTLPITTTFEDERINLGRFAIEIYLNGDVLITNLTRRFWFYDHPHVRESVPCLGNIQEGVAKLIGTYQLAAVTQVLIDFLQIVNPREWVVSAEYWRDV